MILLEFDIFEQKTFALAFEMRNTNEKRIIRVTKCFFTKFLKEVSVTLENKISQ
jgi:hypothetical protein